jgi:hypothetical protein
MIHARENLASAASLLGSAIALLGLLEAETAITLLGTAVSAASAAGAIYSRRKRDVPHFDGASIEGLNLDLLHISNHRRRLNRSLLVERAFQVAIIDGPDLNIAWQYDGFCRSEVEPNIEFSIDSEGNTAFDKLDCFAFDLQNDPGRLQKIKPVLVGNDGFSKKVSAQFLEPLKRDDRFSMLLQCNLPGCNAPGVQYYASSLSFDQRSINSTTVHLIFVGARPNWVRLYDFDKRARPRLRNELRPFRDDGATCEFVDMARDVPGQSVFVYVFDVPAVRNTRRSAHAA